jgi:hypothetical protein
MKTIRLKIDQAISIASGWSIDKGKMVAAITLLFIAAMVPLTAAAIKTIPVVSESTSGQLQPGHNLPKPAVVKAIATEQVVVQENIPSKTEKLFSIIVGMVLPVSILSLFFYLQYASDGFTEKLISGNKSS